MSSDSNVPPEESRELEPLPVVLPADETPLTVLPAEERPRPPQPGFWMALVWSVVFFLVLNGSAIVALVPIMLVEALISSNPNAFLEGLVKDTTDGNTVPSAALARMLAPAVLAGQVIAILFAWLVVRTVVGRTWMRELALHPPSPAHLLLLLVGMPGFILLPEAVAALARMMLPSTDYQKDLDELLRHWHWIYGVLGIGLGAGIGEELWCRGFLGRGLVARYGVGWGIVITSLLFGLMHLDPPHVVATAFMGAILHFVYVNTRSLVAPMVVHALNNSVAFFAVYLQENYAAVRSVLERYESTSLPERTPLYAASAVLLTTIGWALYRSRIVVVALDNAAGLAWQPHFPGVASPPPESGATLARHRLGALVIGAVLAAILLFAGALWWTAGGAKHAPQRASPRRAASVS